MKVNYLSFGVAFLLVLSLIAPIQSKARAPQESPARIEGIWEGALDTGAFKLRLLMKISRLPDGKLKGTLDSLDQGANDIPMSVVTFEGGKLHVEIKSIQASYDGTLNADGTQLSGEFTQGG